MQLIFPLHASNNEYNYVHSIAYHGMTQLLVMYNIAYHTGIYNMLNILEFLGIYDINYTALHGTAWHSIYCMQ